MNKILTGLVAGFAATAVLSMLMVMKGMMGLMPDVDIVHMLAMKMGSGAPMGWIAHFMIGTIGYGIAYALFFSRLPIACHPVRGLMLGVAGWFMMMVVVMPMMGNGVFGLSMSSGMMVPIATLMLHVIFGVVLGVVYAKLHCQCTEGQCALN